MNEPALRQRLAAILAADAAGYSRLMSLDERATVAALDAARAVFRSHTETNRGRVIDMAGDSVLAVFETATGAVSAALSVQAEINPLADAAIDDRRMRFRIGVHLGDVIEKPDGTVYGDGVNIAARLEGLAEPGGITISDSVRIAVKGKVSADFEDQGEQTVKNIADPVRAYRLRVEGSAIAASTATVTRSPAQIAQIDLSLPDKPSIAVLPFTNMSGDPEQEYFTDGITEDIITELSRFRSLFVIARNSSFTYKGKRVDVRTVAKELGVRYVLEGSIRRAGSRIRVTAQLIDALTGKHIWAEKYDRVLDDIFAVQEDLTSNIVSTIAGQIELSEQSLATRQRPGNLSVYELAVRARALGTEGWRRSDRTKQDEAIRLARAALEIDPNSAIALRALAFVRLGNLILTNVPDLANAWNEGMESVSRAIELDQSSQGHAIKAWLLAFAPADRRWEEAFLEAEAAYRLNPNDSASAHALGFMLLNKGEAIKAVKMFEQSLRINPIDPYSGQLANMLALGYWILKDYGKALEWAMRAHTAQPDAANPVGYMAAIYVGLKDIQKARQAFETMRRLAPKMAERWLGGEASIARSTDRERITIFLRIAAGLEDPSAADALR